MKEQNNVINRFGKAEFLVAELESGYDFLFIDACNVDYREHLSLFMDTFNEEAVFVAENIIGQNESVKECLDFMKSTQRFANMTLPGDSELEISVFKKKATVIGS